tara:strand:+ start:323 stop:1162 length:840 start_codon:yes stop_codon:yes gene_type:complete
MAVPVPIQSYTLTYNPDASGMLSKEGGWPSFYSFMPDYMIGMNNYFYSFKRGNLWRHNTNETRNNYYGFQYKSTITSVFNVEPTLSVKLFKTMSYESTTTVTDTTQAAWKCVELNTDLTDGSPGSMLSTYFVQKEGEWFSFLRNNAGTLNYKSRSVNGIGEAISSSVPVVGFTTINFANQVGSIISIGDSAYAVEIIGGVATAEPAIVGEVTQVTDTSITIEDSNLLPVIVGQFILYSKNAVAESHGARGYFLQFKLENDSTDPVELFSVGSSVMKSNP